MSGFSGPRGETCQLVILNSTVIVSIRLLNRRVNSQRCQRFC